VYSLGNPEGRRNFLAGGIFSSLGGQSRANFGRLFNTDPAVESLAFDNSSVTWLRKWGGARRSGGPVSISPPTVRTGLRWGDASRTTGGCRPAAVIIPPRSVEFARVDLSPAGVGFGDSGWNPHHHVPTWQPHQQRADNRNLQRFRRRRRTLGLPMAKRWSSTHRQRRGVRQPHACVIPIDLTWRRRRAIPGGLQAIPGAVSPVWWLC